LTGGKEKSSGAAIEQNEDLPDGLRISQPALNLAKQWEVELTSLPIGPLVTEKTIRDIIKKKDVDTTKVQIDPLRLVIYGGGGHGKSVIDAIRSQSKYSIHGVLDDGLEIGSQVLDIPVLGGGEILPQLYQQGIGQAVNAVGGIGDIRSRISIFQQLSMQNFSCPTIIHASAVVEDSANLSSGIQVFPLAYIGSETHLGFGVIINTSAVVSHDCHLADYVNISPGALLAGGVHIGRGTLVGMGATINLGVSIGENVRIGNGATIKSDIPDGSIVRAGMIWPD
jgi:sugar O-acyltransferase (sialic acid O-acetyltransferase NeuD family)